MPRYVLEAPASGGILLFVLYLLWAREGGLEAVLPLLAAFAFSGIKLLPTMQALFADPSRLRFDEPAPRALVSDLAEPATPARTREAGIGEADLPTLGRDVRLDDVHHRYPGAAATALHGLTVSIGAGRMVGVVGPTGSGKTTVTDVILGLLPPERGRLLIHGVAVGPANRGAWQRRIGYLPQSINLVDDTAAANVAFGEEAARIDRDGVARVAQMARIDGFVATLPRGYDTSIGKAGMRLAGSGSGWAPPARSAATRA